MSSGDIGLTEKQLEAARLLAEGYSRSKVAAMCEVHRSYIYIWLKEPEFKEYLDDMLSEARDATKAKLGILSNSALDTLKTIIEDPKEPGNVRVNACAKVIEFVLGEANSVDLSRLPSASVATPNRKELLRIANQAHKEAYGLMEGKE